MKKLFLMTLAGTLMFACQKPNVVVTDNGDTKKVSIKIKTNAATRAELGYEVPAGAITKLTGGTIFFFDAAGNTVLTYTLQESDFQAHAANVTIDGVPSSAATVAMIANAADDLSETAPDDFEEFLDASFEIVNQTSMATATGLTGEENDENRQPLAIQGIALLDELNGNNTATELSDEDIPEGAEYTQTASINLVPAVARIEIGSLAVPAQGDTPAKSAVPAIAVKDVAGDATNLTGLVSFDFEGIYINNYSPTFTLGFAQANPLFGSTIQPNTADTDWAAAYKGLTQEMFPPEEPESEEFVSFYDEGDSAGEYVYHVFPGTGVPHIIIKGSNFLYADGRTVTTPKYWRIDTYWTDNTKTENVKWEPGFVYKIGQIAVGDTYPTDDPYDEQESVQVTVTVRAWQVQNTYVEPE